MPKEGNVQSTTTSFCMTDDRRQLVMVSDQDKLVCHSQGTDAGGKRDLRSLVDDAVVKSTTEE